MDIVEAYNRSLRMPSLRYMTMQYVGLVIERKYFYRYRTYDLVLQYRWRNDNTSAWNLYVCEPGQDGSFLDVSALFQLKAQGDSVGSVQDALSLVIDRFEEYQARVGDHS